MPINRGKALLLAVAASVAVSGCGGPSETDQIKDLVNEYVAAFAAKDGAKVCSLLTKSAQRKVQASAGLLRGKDCAATITAVAKLTTGTDADRIKQFRAGRVVVDGNEAGVRIEPSSPDSKPTRLVKVDGKWLFDGSVSNVD